LSGAAQLAAIAEIEKSVAFCWPSSLRGLQSESLWLRFRTRPYFMALAL
jgi:hypothetical protein